MNFVYFSAIGFIGYCFYVLNAKADTMRYFPNQPSEPYPTVLTLKVFIMIMRTTPRREILDPYMREGFYVFLCFAVAFIEDIYSELKPDFDRNRQLPQIQAEEP